MFKKGKRILSLLLCVAMVFSSLPLTALAEDAPAAPAASITTNILKKNLDGSFTEMSQSEIASITNGSKFYFGIKAEKWDQIPTLSASEKEGGMVSCAFAINFRNDIFIVEPTQNEDFTDSKVAWSKEIVKRLGDNSFAKKGDEYTFKDSSKPAGRSVRPSDSVLKDSENASKWKQMYFVAAYSSPTNTKYAWHGEDDQYLLIIEMGIKDDATLPENGATVLCWPDTDETSVLSVAGGAKNKQYTFKAQNTAWEITKQMSFQDGNLQYLFPEAGKITGAPVIKGGSGTDGAIVYGDELTADKGTLACSDSSEMGAITYTWAYADVDKKDSTTTSDWTTITPVDGEVAVTKAMVGKVIKLSATAANLDNTAAVTSAAVAKKALAVADDWAYPYASGKTNINWSKDAQTLTGTYTFGGVESGDTVTTTYSGTVAAGKETKESVEFTFDAITNDYYTFSGATKTVDVAIAAKPADTVTAIAAKSNPTKTAYKYGDKLDLSGLALTVTYQIAGAIDKDAAWVQDNNDVEFTFMVGDTKVDLSKYTVKMGDNKLTVKSTSPAFSQDYTISVAKGDASIVWGNTEQRVKSATGMSAVTAALPDGTTDGITVTYQIPACTTVDCDHSKCGMGAAEAWKALESTEFQAYLAALSLPVENLKVKAAFAGNDNYNALGTDAQTTVKLTKKSSGGSHSSSGSTASEPTVTKYTVTFKAGANGEFAKNATTSVKVAKDSSLVKSDIPSVTAKEGFRFIGWSLDGKTVVDPTDVKVTKAVTYTALYKESTGSHDAYMNGNDKGEFKPDASITRAEAAALLARLVPDYNKETNYTGSFSDVKAGAWYANEVYFDVEKGFITGYENGTFKPDNKISRQEFAIIVARYLGMENEGAASFADCKGVYAEGYISQLVAKGIIGGYSDGTFRPDAPITRAEATKVLNGVFDRVPDKAAIDAAVANYNVSLTDVSKKHWAYYEILEAAVDHEIIDFHK